MAHVRLLWTQVFRLLNSEARKPSLRAVDKRGSGKQSWVTTFQVNPHPETYFTKYTSIQMQTLNWKQPWVTTCQVNPHPESCITKYTSIRKLTLNWQQSCVTTFQVNPHPGSYITKYTSMRR